LAFWTDQRKRLYAVSAKIGKPAPVRQPAAGFFSASTLQTAAD
jgi:hypothetical protein